MVIYDLQAGDRVCVTCRYPNETRSYDAKVTGRSDHNVVIDFKDVDSDNMAANIRDDTPVTVYLLRNGEPFLKFTECKLYPAPEHPDSRMVHCDHIGTLMEQRAYKRYNVQMECCISIEGNQFFNATLVDVSREGLAIASNARGLRIGAGVRVNFFEKEVRKAITVDGIVSNSRGNSMIKVYGVNIEPTEEYLDFIRRIIAKNEEA